MNKYLESQNPIVITREKYTVLSAASDYLNYNGHNESGLPYVRLLNDSFLGSTSSEHYTDRMSGYLADQTPIILQPEQSIERYDGSDTGSAKNNIIIPPLNTDVRFSSVLPLYEPTESERNGVSFTHPNIVCNQVIIPPLNTDIRFSNELPLLSADEQENILKDEKKYLPWEHEHPHKKHSKGLHVHEDIQENFSWAIPTKNDTTLDLIKKSIIHEVTAQHACGSCWELYIFVNM